MESERLIYGVDLHAEGIPVRVILSGIPDVPGKSMAEKQHNFERSFGKIRKKLLREPVGYEAFVGSFLTNPISSEADYGVIFAHPEGYFDMCIDGSIATAAALVKTGIVPPKEPTTTVRLDTVSGVVTVNVSVKNARVSMASVQNVPSYFKGRIAINLPDLHQIPVDIAYGGNLFAHVDAEDIGIAVKPENAEKLKIIGMKVLEAVREQIPEVSLVQIYDSRSVSMGSNFRNVLIYGKSQIGRAPCGTGTSAKLATLYERGKIKLNEEIVNESIIGTKYYGKVLFETSEGVVPEISGCAWITSISTFVFEKGDPLEEGYLL